MQGKINVIVWNEFIHERKNEAVRKVYPDGIHKALGQGLLQNGNFEPHYATLDEPEHGLPQARLEKADVLIWWGHAAHGKVDDAVVRRVQLQVLAGMGLVVLHSGHLSKIFRALMGTNCSLRWREAAEKERIWNVEPGHPITEGIGDYFELPNEEMYGERFDVPTPDKVVFISWFEGGEVFRSGCCWERGHGRIFYFRPGHETYSSYRDPNVLKVVANACRWAGRRVSISTEKCPNVPPLEKLADKSARFGTAGIKGL